MIDALAAGLVFAAALGVGLVLAMVTTKKAPAPRCYCGKPERGGMHTKQECRWNRFGVRRGKKDGAP